MLPDQHPPLPAADDPTAESRKKDHIELAFQSRVGAAALDGRFWYEPMLAAHPEPGTWPPFPFMGHQLRSPMWVSSMTGGTALAGTINHNLARLCAEFGMGMGLGSCRQLLHSREHLPDFDVRDTLGPNLPLYANLGVAQVEHLLERGEAAERIPALLALLRADGLIVHVNPLQEAMQPEGDHFRQPALATVAQLLDLQLPGPELLGMKLPGSSTLKIIVKEVGQGMGPESLRALLQLPLEAVEFAAAGGTNFAKLELLRSEPAKQAIFEKIAAVGHSAAEMLDFVNAARADLGDRCQVRHLIISGGVEDFLDGFYLLKKSALPAVYGQASAFLRHARGDYAELQAYAAAQLRGLELAGAFLRVR